MLLRQVLQELKASRGPVSINALSRKLGVEPSALEGMIAFWVRKGRLKEDYATAVIETCTRGDCETSCSRAQNCQLATGLPRGFSFVSQKNPPGRQLED